MKNSQPSPHEFGATHRETYSEMVLNKLKSSGLNDNDLARVNGSFINGFIQVKIKMHGSEYVGTLDHLDDDNTDRQTKTGELTISMKGGKKKRFNAADIGNSDTTITLFK